MGPGPMDSLAHGPRARCPGPGLAAWTPRHVVVDHTSPDGDFTIYDDHVVYKGTQAGRIIHTFEIKANLMIMSNLIPSLGPWAGANIGSVPRETLTKSGTWKKRGLVSRRSCDEFEPWA